MISNFYEENCSKEGLPTVFANKCREAAPIVSSLQNRINCILDLEIAKLPSGDRKG